MNIDSLEETIGYKFCDKELLKRALTHPSVRSNNKYDNYQRLEFLGDAVLELSMSKILYKRLENVREGQLTRLRADLVREETLYIIAQKIDLGKYIYLSPGEEKTGGRQKSSILSDVTEAVIGAVFLDSSFETAFALIDRLYSGLIDEEKLMNDAMDAKTRLQELVQKDGKMPFYEMIETRGPAHEPTYVYRVYVKDDTGFMTEAGSGSGRSKQAAQQAAARYALEHFVK